MKKTVIFDFDGVIHSYVSGWQGVDKAIDPPITETIEAIKQLRGDGYEVIVVSTRCDCLDGMETIHKYLDKYGIIVDGVSATKPPAIVSVDDRCICFVPGMDVVSAVKDFCPWRDISSTPSKGE